MKYYVQVTAEYYRDYAIEADSKEDAEEQAIEKFDYDVDSQWDSIEAKAE